MLQIANEYAKQPEETLVVSPDNQSRMEINQVIHTEMQARGQVDHREERLNVLAARQEITGVDRQWAEQYQLRHTSAPIALARCFGALASCLLAITIPVLKLTFCTDDSLPDAA